MRRWVAVAAAVLISSVPVAANAAGERGGGPDTVGALKRQLRSEHGVRISEATRFYYGAKSKVSGSGIRISGSLQLAPSGPVAADFAWWELPRPGDKLRSTKSNPYRVIRVGTTVYDDAAHYPGGPVPEGKKWVHFPNKHRGRMGRDLARDASLQPIDVYAPSMLRAVLGRSTGKPVSGGFLYYGTMSYQEFVKVSTSAFINWTSGRPVTAKTKGKISWRLWTGRDGVLRRLVTADTVGGGKDPLVKRSDTRYTGWGFHLVVSAPPAREVIDEADLLDYIRRQNEPIPTDAGNT